MNKIPPMISIVGKRGTGKTSLLEKLIPELKSRGYLVAAIKHDAHSFEIDKPGKTTWRYAEAGADVVAISSATKMAYIAKREEEMSLDELGAMMSFIDIVLTDGFSGQNKPKIETYQHGLHDELLCRPEEMLAVASDQPLLIGVPCYDINNIAGMADEIERYIISYRLQEAAKDE